MAAPSVVVDLVEHFARNADVYRSSLNETELRVQFIDPFFEALGWDIHNKQHFAETYKDVVHEYGVHSGTHFEAPDYCFRVGGTRKFFVEAKRPAVHVSADPAPAYQLRSYAWTSKLPLSLLTNFAEFAVYDCRTAPHPGDKASAGRVDLITFDQYPDRWSDIEERFSKQAVYKGSFDRYTESTKLKKGTAEVDEAFLDDIEGWRKDLASSIALRNPSLTQLEVNFAVQRTIDRLIFLRICEDRGIEKYGQLREAQNNDNIYGRLCTIFERADEKYNSGLFHFTEEKDRAESPDELTRSLKIDDGKLKGILQRLYYPDSPYQFSHFPADILGQVYEQFLGQVIRLTSGHQARVELKPEVKKAGGVFYTPTFVVDHIVQNTVGELLKEKDPKQVSRLRILDPACGSGSFLIGAYQFLLDWHRDWYLANGGTGKHKVLYETHGGNWRLTSTEKKRILLANIYGVDVDVQAVEVTKLSLLLKVLEGEDEQTIGANLKLFHERALPDLGNNIKCGNSIIGSDFYRNQQLLLIDNEERLRINAFDWGGDDGFPKIMSGGGFDVVLGNPPYVDIKTLPDNDVEYLFSRYQFSDNRINLFAAFIERSLSLAREKQFRFSMIIPTAFLTQSSYRQLRKMICNEYQPIHIARLPNESFGAHTGDVKVDTAIVVVAPHQQSRTHVDILSYAGYARISRISADTAHAHIKADSREWANDPDCIWSVNTEARERDILKKCETSSLPLERNVEFCLGLTPYDKYKGHTPKQIESRVFHADRKKNATFKPLLAGNDVGRYWVKWNGEEWISYGPWLGAPREQRFFTEKRILVKQIIDWTAKRIWATIADEELYNTQNAFNLLPRSSVSLEFVLGVLNSKLISYYHQKRFLDEFKMRFQKILIKDCKRLPMRVPDTRVKGSVYASIEQQVSTMLQLQKKAMIARTEHEGTALKRQIAMVDATLDQLVYNLYGLTAEEVAIIEAHFKPMAIAATQGQG
jgi:type I restriction-modification system DNA methylase subunit